MREIGVGKEEEGGEGRRPFSFFLPFSFFPLPAREQFRGGIFISQPRILFLFPSREEPNYFLFFYILFREKERGNGDFGLKGEKEDVFPLSSSVWRDAEIVCWPVFRVSDATWTCRQTRLFSSSHRNSCWRRRRRCCQVEEKILKEFLLSWRTIEGRIVTKRD